MSDTDRQLGEYDARLQNLETKVDDIAKDVKSLLASRSFTRGVWQSVVVTATAVSALVGLVLHWWTGRLPVKP
jgi:hypothetical protein